MTLQDSDIQRVYSLPPETLNKARAIAAEFEGWPSVIRGRLEEELNLPHLQAYYVEWVLTENIPDPSSSLLRRMNRLLVELLSDFKQAWKAGSPKRDAFWYLNNHHITPRECLWLEQYPENE
jgi:hypothetical protein